MPTPHVDAVLSDLKQPWFFAESAARATAAAQGANYARTLKGEFDRRGDKAAIETGLKLGSYALHTQANKRKRQALRAVLLAEVLMMKKPPVAMEQLHSRYKSLDFNALKRALVNKFPLGSGHQGLRHSWAPSNFTDPIELADLRTQQDWRSKAVPEYRFLVHANSDPKNTMWQDPVGEMAKYSGSSFSLMSNTKPYIYAASGMVQGVIFRVPANNILVTHSTDLMTQLHSGSVRSAGPDGHTYADEILELAAATRIETPGDLLRKTASDSTAPKVGLLTGSRYNEVVVCGKPGVPLPWGTTGQLKVVGLFMLTTKDGKLLQPYDAEDRLKLMEAHAKRLKQRPLLFLPHAP